MNPLQPTTDLIVQSFGLFAQEIKRISQESKSAETADLAANAERLEGLTLNEIVELIAGTAGLTVAQVKQELDDFIETLVNVPTVKANADTVMDKENNDAIVTPEAMWNGIEAWYAVKVGAAPDTLDEIHEIAAALRNNPEIIDVLEDRIALKATKVELQEAVSTLEAKIGDSKVEFATQEDVDAGLAGDLVVAPDTLSVRLNAAVSQMQEAIMTDVDGSLAAINMAIQAAIVELQTTDEPSIEQ